MNVDDAMETAAEFKVEMKVRPHWTLFSETVAVVLAAEVERLRAELAEAKAASVCPVDMVDCYFTAIPEKVAITLAKEYEVRPICKSGLDAQEVTNWLRDRMKDKSPPQA